MGQSECAAIRQSNISVAERPMPINNKTWKKEKWINVLKHVTVNGQHLLCKQVAYQERHRCSILSSDRSHRGCFFFAIEAIFAFKILTRSEDIPSKTLKSLRYIDLIVFWTSSLLVNSLCQGSELSHELILFSFYDFRCYSSESFHR